MRSLQVIDKLFLRNDELEIKGIFIHLPFLPLKRKYEKNYIVMYRYSFEKHGKLNQR